MSYTAKFVFRNGDTITFTDVEQRFAPIDGRYIVEHDDGGGGGATIIYEHQLNFVSYSIPKPPAPPPPIATPNPANYDKPKASWWGKII